MVSEVVLVLNRSDCSATYYVQAMVLVIKSGDRH